VKKENLRIYKLALFDWEGMRSFIEFHSRLANVGVFDSSSLLRGRVIDIISSSDKIKIESVNFLDITPPDVPIGASLTDFWLSTLSSLGDEANASATLLLKESI
jgi:hypothetical protein